MKLSTAINTAMLFLVSATVILAQDNVIHITLNRQPVQALKVITGKLPKDVAVAEIIAEGAPGTTIKVAQIKRFLAQSGYSLMEKQLSGETIDWAQARSKTQIGRDLFGKFGPLLQGGAVASIIKNGAGSSTSIGLAVSAIVSLFSGFKTPRERGLGKVNENPWIYAKDEWALEGERIGTLEKRALLKYDRNLSDAVVIRSTGDEVVR